MSYKNKIKALILLFLTKKRKKKFELSNARNFLFFRYDRIGDMIISTPVFRELKSKFPFAKITVLASEKNKNVLLNNPYVDEIITNHKHNFFKDLKKLIKLRRFNYDVCIEFDHSVIPHCILRLLIIKPKFIISVAKDGRYGVSGSRLELYDLYTPRNNYMHYREICLATLKPFFIQPNSLKYDLFLSKEVITRAENFLLRLKDSFLVGINIYGAVPGKFIDKDSFLKICNELNSKHKDIHFILLYEPNRLSEVEKYIDLSIDNITLSYETSTIHDVAAIIKNIDLIITPDTSISHVASVFNKPIVTIHENNKLSHKLFAPVSDDRKVVFSPRKNSLVGFNVARVVEYANELINKIKK